MGKRTTSPLFQETKMIVPDTTSMKTLVFYIPWKRFHSCTQQPELQSHSKRNDSEWYTKGIVKIKRNALKNLQVLPLSFFRRYLTSSLPSDLFLPYNWEAFQTTLDYKKMFLQWRKKEKVIPNGKEIEWHGSGTLLRAFRTIQWIVNIINAGYN